MLYLLLITSIIYIGMIIISEHKTSIALIGSGLLLIIGVLTKSFDVNMAFSNFPSEIIILLIVLTLFSDNFERLGLINYIGYRYIGLSKESKVIIMITIPFVMYFISMFMNNLTVVLLFTYMALYFAIEYHLPVIPLLVSIVIGSNIGGAALPWADTPAVIITLYTDFTLIDFMNKLFVPCLVFSLALCFYTLLWYKKTRIKKREMPFKVKPYVDWKGSILPLILFLLYIVGISIAPFYDISIAYISLIFGGLLLFTDRKKAIDALNDLHIMDSISFFIALFIIAGVLQSSGILEEAAKYIMNCTDNNPYLIVLSVLFLSFLISTFLSAGPATATLLPICAALTVFVPFKLVYAALALGILSGSSMFPWSATGGPILLSQTNEFLKMPHIRDEIEESEKIRIRKINSVKEYITFSIPFALFMVIVSAIYLCVFLKILV